MAYFVYPDRTVLPGLGFSVTKRSVWGGIRQNMAAGETLRYSFYSTPVYEWDLVYNVLRTGEYMGQNYTEFDDLQGFYNKMQGPTLPFLFTDPDDSIVTSQPVVFGAAQPVQVGIPYTIIRTFGGSTFGTNFTEPVAQINLGQPINVYLDGTLLSTSDYTINTSVPYNNTITLSVTGSPGEVTMDFSYYWLVRFLDTNLQFDRQFIGLWDIKKVSLHQVIQIGTTVVGA